MDLSRLALVALAIACIYAVALGHLFTVVRRWRRRRSGAPFPLAGSRTGKIIHRLRVTSSALALLGLPVVAWGFYEPYFPEVTRTEVPSPKLASRVRIVHLSDLHSDPRARLEPRLPSIVRALGPDLIVFTGDALNSDEGLPNFQRCMRELAQVAPTFTVRGNWEEWWFADLDVFANTGVTELAGGALPLHVRGQELWISGTAVDHEYQIADMLEAVPRDRLSLFLHHFPSTWHLARLHGVDLHLAGDTHGGQIALPWIGPLVRIARHDGRFYASGLHREGSSALYVSRGIGMEGGSAPRVRLGCRPEVAVIDLVPAAP